MDAGSPSILPRLTTGASFEEAARRQLLTLDPQLRGAYKDLFDALDQAEEKKKKYIVKGEGKSEEEKNSSRNERKMAVSYAVHAFLRIHSLTAFHCTCRNNSHERRGS